VPTRAWGEADHAKIRAAIKKGTLPSTALDPPGVYVACLPTKVNGDCDGVRGSKLSVADTRAFRMAELEKKRAALSDAQISSPALRISFKTPDQGARTKEAIEVASGAPSDSMQAGPCLLSRTQSQPSGDDCP
jgi:hypothetical protein